ncbi:hypothetical protein, partial [Gilliamella sp. B3771]|uniref:hypothetical protein n=1 Tax=Gilliamella sp. B3771 TaxID=2818013 RepID=UPI00226A5142
NPIPISNLKVHCQEVIDSKPIFDLFLPAGKIKKLLYLRKLRKTNEKSTICCINSIIIDDGLR